MPVFVLQPPWQPSPRLALELRPAEIAGGTGVKVAWSIIAMRHIEITGYHGCPFFVTAAKIAEALHRRGVVQRVTIRRAGHIHVPEWGSKGDYAAWDTFRDAQARTVHWKGTSPHVVIDGLPAIGATELLRACASWLEAETFDVGGIALTSDFWPDVEDNGADALWVPAYRTAIGAFTSVDPAGVPLVGVIRDGLHYDDLGLHSGPAYPVHGGLPKEDLSVST